MNDCAGVCGRSARNYCSVVFGLSAVRDCAGVCVGCVMQCSAEQLSAVILLESVVEYSAVIDFAGVCDGSAVQCLIVLEPVVAAESVVAAQCND